MRERFTYRLLIQLIGAVAGFLLVAVKILKIPVVINGTLLQPDDLQTLGLAAGAVLTVVVPLFIPDTDKPIFPKRDAALSEATRKDNRQRMLDKVEAIWITGYLDRVLNEMAALRLDMKFVEPEKVLQRAGMTDKDLPDSGAILEAFNELGRKLVILGEPGAGKTVTLLQLCRELIAEARKDERKPIPIVLALSSWAAEQPPFEEWLRKEVREKYGLSKKDADDLVVGEQLLYLLDGLDEVAEAQRDVCLQAIKRFVEIERPVDYAICCRRKEFVELPTHLKIAGEIALQPLDDLQIGEYLSSDEFPGLPAIWMNSTELRDFGRIPFMLNTIAVVTRGKNERQIRQEIEIVDDAEQLRDELLEAYMNRRLKEAVNIHYPDLRLTRNRVRWLAKQLVNHHQTDFYIENLQADWVDNDAQVRGYQWAVRLIFALLFILIVGLLFGILGGLEDGIVFGLLIGLPFGLIFGGRISNHQIRISDPLNWETNRTRADGFAEAKEGEIRPQPNAGIGRLYRRLLLAWAISGLISGLSVGLLIAGIVHDAASGAVIGLAFAVFGGATIGLIQGGSPVLQHSIIRYFLARSKHIPYWRYDKFLDYCADLVILRKVGGGYRFVHDYLRQYLASATFLPDTIPTPPEN